MFELELSASDAAPALAATWRILSRANVGFNGDDYRLTYSVHAAGPELPVFDILATYTPKRDFPCKGTPIAQIALSATVTGAAGAAGAAGDF